MMIALRLFLLWMLVPASVMAQPGQAGATPTAPLALEDLERMALDNNPTLRQAMTGVTAAQGRARQAGTWFNP
ncbi:MAG TPA: hypothetical protein VIK60_02340, partial [Vicinamibacterales bacterium]